MEFVLLRFTIQQQCVMLARKVFFARSAGFIIPYDLVYKVFPSENLIHEDLHIMCNMPVQVHCDTSCIRQQITHEKKPGRQHLQIRFQCRSTEIIICIDLNSRRIS